MTKEKQRSTTRVTVSFPLDLLRGIDRLEKNGSKFNQDAVRHEMERRRREELHRSLENPHPESRELAEFGLEDWAARVPKAAVDGLLDPEEGTVLHYNLTEDEAKTLDRGGLDLTPREAGEVSAFARTKAKYAAILETSLTTSAAADVLGVETSRVRQRLAARTLYGIRTPSGWRLPAFQFSKDGLLPELGEVFSRLSPSLHPVAVHNFFTSPHVDLWVEELGRELSPSEWLQAGYPAGIVTDLAANLE